MPFKEHRVCLSIAEHVVGRIIFEFADRFTILQQLLHHYLIINFIKIHKLIILISHLFTSKLAASHLYFPSSFSPSSTRSCFQSSMSGFLTADISTLHPNLYSSWFCWSLPPHSCLILPSPPVLKANSSYILFPMALLEACFL